MCYTFLTGTYYALPLVVTLNRDTGYAYVEMTEKDICSEVVVTYLPSDPEHADYSASYFVLFGRNIKEGETLTARVRGCVIKMDEDFNVPLRLYKEFANGI